MKPSFLDEQHAHAFQSAEVATAYRHRPPYTPEAISFLSELPQGTRKRVLDVGCGTGFIARPIAPLAAHVDAVDISGAMVKAGKLLPGGVHPNLHWQVAPIESAVLDPPYDLITAGDSLHWMNWDLVFPLFGDSLARHGKLVLLSVITLDPPWQNELLDIIKRFSTMKDYYPYDLTTLLEKDGFFKVEGKHLTTPVPFEQPLNHYIESFHGRSSLSRNIMGEDATAAFDKEVFDLVRSFQKDGVTLEIATEIVWGEPLCP